MNFQELRKNRPLVNEDTDVEYLYRVEGVVYHPGIDEFGEPLPGKGRPHIYTNKYKIIKRTPKGAWIDTYGLRKRFVLLTARKKYACENEDDALKSFIERKKSQIRILSSKLYDSKRFLELAESKMQSNQPKIRNLYHAN